MVSPRRVSVVVGAGRGIGAETARLLAARGDAVVLVDRASDDPRVPYHLASRADLCAALGAARDAAADPAMISSAVADITDEQALGAVIAATEAAHGGVDAVVVAAGVIAGGLPLWEMPTMQVEAVLGVDLGGVVNAARVALPALLRRPEPREGRFVAIASTAATRGMPMLAAYCAAKAGVTGLIRGLAAELRGTGITANCVSPGSTDTQILAESARLYHLAGPQDFVPQEVIGRLIEPAEVATTLAWLAGAESGAVTGSNLAVDGGLAL
jgi:SDR family mycofactocin-dependent oxidoreductase